MTIRALPARFAEAARILLGTRPAAVRFDRLDRTIAEACAFRAADRITPGLEDRDADHERVRGVAALVMEAIESYAKFPKGDERAVRRNLEYKPPPPPTDIPF